MSALKKPAKIPAHLRGHRGRSGYFDSLRYFKINIVKIVITIARPKPRGRKDLKRIRAPKKTIAHDAPSKKLRILSNLSFCI